MFTAESNERLCERIVGHHSWHRPEVPAWLAEHGLDLVSVDVPDLRALYPRGLAQSGPRVYVRFHSRDGSTPLSSPSMSMPVSSPNPNCARKSWVTSMSLSPASM